MDSTLLREVDVPIKSYPKDFPLFLFLATDWGSMFFREDTDVPQLKEQIFFLMKRLSQQRSEILKMPRKERLFYYRLEYEIFKVEKEKPQI